MYPHWLAWLAVLLLASMGFAQESEDNDLETVKVSSKVSTERPGKTATKVCRLIEEYTNEFRRSQDLEKVESNPRLSETAQYFANFMATTDKYGHHADGNRPSGRAEEHGYDYCLISENIAYEYTSAEISATELSKRFVEGWKHSPGHRRNMLDEAALETGVGAAQSEETGYWYAVQMFGRPKSAQIEFSIANQADLEFQYTIDDRNFTLPPRYTRTHMRCRPASITFKFPKEEGGETTVTSADGGVYIVAPRDGRLTVNSN